MEEKKEKILYEEEFKALNRAGINYAVCGGAAVVFFGFSRLTIDLDLIVSLEKENLEKLYDVLMRLNYKPKVPIKKEDFVQKEKLEALGREKNMKVVSFYNMKDPMKVIDTGVNLPNITEILKRKRDVKVNSDFKIPLILIDDLIKMKEDVGREQDLIDVAQLKKIKQYEKNKKDTN